MSANATGAARVAIAEDEPSILASIEFLMRRCGYEVRTATDGDEALRVVARFRPQVVILDVMLPRRSGLEVCRAIRADASLGGTRILLLTAKGGATEMQRGLAAGSDDYLIKPFSTHELVARVQTLLAAPGGRAQGGAP